MYYESVPLSLMTLYSMVCVSVGTYLCNCMHNPKSQEVFTLNCPELHDSHA